MAEKFFIHSQLLQKHQASKKYLLKKYNLKVNYFSRCMK